MMSFVINYIFYNKSWKEFEEKEINFTYRSEFEQKLLKLLKELQETLILKV